MSPSDEPPANTPDSVVDPFKRVLPTDVPLMSERAWRAAHEDVRRDHRRQESPLRWLWLVAPLVLGVSAWACVKGWQSIRMGSLVERAVAARASGDLDGAKRLLDEAVVSGEPTVRLSALRVMVSTKWKSEIDELVYLRQLVETAGASEEDERTFVEGALAVKQPDLATRLVEAWLADPALGKDFGRVVPTVEYFSQCGGRTAGLQWVEQQKRAHPQMVDGGLDWAEIRLLASEPADDAQDEAERIRNVTLLVGGLLNRQRHLADAEPEVHRQVLLDLPAICARMPGVLSALDDETWKLAMAKANQDSEQRDLELRLAVASMRWLRASESERGSLSRELAAAVSTPEHAQERLRWASWFMNHESPTVAVSLLENPTDWDAIQGCFKAYLEALGASGKWEQVELTLRDFPQAPVAEVFKHLHRWRCRKQRAVPPATIRAAYQDLLAATRLAPPDQVLEVADALAAWGHQAEAIPLYRLQMASPTVGVRAAFSLWRLKRDEPQDKGEVRDALKVYVTMRPKDDVAASDLLLIELLDGSNPAAAESQARRLLKIQPNSWRKKTALALSLLLQDKAEEADCVQSVSDGGSDPGVLVTVVRCCVMAANSHWREAKEEAKGIPSIRLTPDEQRLLSRFGLFL